MVETKIGTVTLRPKLAEVQQPRRFLYVFKGLRGPMFTIYYDDRPTLAMIKSQGPLVFEVELTGAWAYASLSDIVTEYDRRVAAGLTPKPSAAAKKPDTSERGVAKVGERDQRQTIDEFSTSDAPPAPWWKIPGLC